MCLDRSARRASINCWQPACRMTSRHRQNSRIAFATRTSGRRPSQKHHHRTSRIDKGAARRAGHAQHHGGTGGTAENNSRSPGERQKRTHRMRLAATCAFCVVAGHVAAEDRLQLARNGVAIEHQGARWIIVLSSCPPVGPNRSVRMLSEDTPTSFRPFAAASSRRPSSTCSSSESMLTPRQRVSNLLHLVTQWMSTVNVCAGSARNSSQFQRRPRDAPRPGVRS